MAKFWFGQRPPRTVLVLLPNFKRNKALPTLRIDDTPPDDEYQRLPHLVVNGNILDVLFALPSVVTYRDMDFLDGHMENMDDMDEQDLLMLFQMAGDAGDKKAMRKINDVIHSGFSRS